MKDDLLMAVALGQCAQDARMQIELLDELDPDAKDIRCLLNSILSLYDYAIELAEQREGAGK